MKLAESRITDNNYSTPEQKEGIVISQPTISSPDSVTPDGVAPGTQISNPSMGVKPGVIFNPMEVQEQVKKLGVELSALAVQLEQLVGNVAGFGNFFSTNQLSALIGYVGQLTGGSAEIEEVISSKFNFDADGVEVDAALIVAGTVVYAKTESDHIILVWLREDFFFCVADSNNWRIDSNGNLINVNGAFELFYIGTGAEPYPTVGTIETVIAQGTSVFGQFNYYIAGTSTFEDIVVRNQANIKSLTVTDKINGSIQSADYAVESDYATTAGSAGSATTANSATNDGAGNEITETYATKTEVLPEAKRIQFDNTSHLYICNTEASTSKKVVTITDLDITGNYTFKIMFTNGNTAETVSVEINGTEYALKIYKAGTKSDVYAGMDAGTILEVFFDGTDLVLTSNPIVKQDTSSTSGYTIYSDGRKVYPIEHFAVNNFIQPIVFAGSSGSATLSSGVWVGVFSTAGIGAGVGIALALLQNNSVKYATVIHGNGTASYSGATVTIKSNSIGLPVNWVQITNRYWLS